jgi:secretion/DNA translocation related CpaE-like protein
MGARPLLVSNDAELIDDVLRLAAANSVDVHLSTDAEGARSRWQLAPLVLIGGDVAASVAGAAMSRRRDVVVISRSPTPEDWQRAVLLGAEHVVSLPEGERWLIDRLADSGEGVSRDARVVVVVGCGGGSGASTFAATLALAAASRSSRVLLVDGDPLGGGLDVLLGLEDATGIRWPDLIEARGRLSTTTLSQSLPLVSGVSVLSSARTGPATIDVNGLAAVLDAGVRGYDLVIVDACRQFDAATELALARADQTIIVAATRVRATAAAARLAAELAPRCASLGVVIRAEAGGVHDDAVTVALGIPVIGRIPSVKSVPSRADEGEPPSLRDSYGRACAEALAGILSPRGRAA